MIRIELTEPQCKLLLDALSDAKVNAAQYDHNRFNQYQALRNIVKIQIKATMAEQADATDLKSVSD